MSPTQAKPERIVRLTAPQFKLVTSSAQFPAFVGGFGSGKTEALINRCLARKLQYPTCNVAYYLPTFDLVRTIAFPRFTEKLTEYGIKFTLNKTYATIEIPGCGMIIFRTMDNPERIVGYEVADSFVDELDTLSMEQAQAVWNKILGRNRQKKPDGSLNTIAVGTTPEGFRFVYARWVKLKKEGDGYELIKAPTSSNARNLPPGYIESLQASYPSNLLQAYLEGEFVNLQSGAVYPMFDRVLNACDCVILPNETIHIGMDFNVGNMTAILNVLRNGPRAVGEITGLADTPAMISAIKARCPGHQIIVYPDSSGKSRRSTDASVSDIALLRQARFNVIVNTQNPAVKDRILSFNKMIVSREFQVNVDACPMLVETLEKQAYDKHGEPDKSGGLDHPGDAEGYFITQRWPIRELGMKRLKIVGV